MKNILILAASAALLVVSGCSPAPVPVVVDQQPQAQTVAATCLDGRGYVIQDNYCDPGYIAQQRQLAIQQNNQALLASLLAYHMIYSSTPYGIGMYASPGSYYTTAPRGYVVQSRTTYVTHNTTIVNHTQSTPSTSTTSTVNKSYVSPNASAARPAPVSRPPTQTYTSTPTVRTAPSPVSRSYSSSSSSSSSKRR
jgi:hypothetical protein